MLVQNRCILRSQLSSTQLCKCFSFAYTRLLAAVAAAAAMVAAVAAQFSRLSEVTERPQRCHTQSHCVACTQTAVSCDMEAAIITIMIWQSE